MLSTREPLYDNYDNNISRLVQLQSRRAPRAMDLPEEGVIAGFDAAANRPFRAIESAAAHLVLVVHGIGISKMEDFEGSVQQVRG